MIRVAFALTLVVHVSIAAAGQAPARDAVSRDASRVVPLHGRVLAEDGSVPVRRARIAVVGSGLRSIDPIYTDADGRFEVTVLRPGGDTIRVTKAGFVAKEIAPLELSAKGLDVRLATAAVLAGTLTDPNGDPRVGVPVQLRLIGQGQTSNTQALAGQTDDLGNFRIGGLAPGRYSVAIPCCDRTYTSNAASIRFRIPKPQEVQLLAGQTVNLSFTETTEITAPRPMPLEVSAVIVSGGGELPRGWPAPAPARTTNGASVRGRVTGPDGAAVSDARVSLSGTSGTAAAKTPLSLTTLTDAAGRFEFTGFGSGHYMLLVRKQEFVHAREARGDNVAPSPGIEITVADRERLNNVDVVLRKGASVSGRITDSTGRPVQNAIVRTQRAGSDGTARSDVEGRFEVKELPAGVLSVGVVVPGALARSVTSVLTDDALLLRQTVVLAEGQRVDGVDFVLPKGGAISGRIIDEYGEPIEGAIVQALRARGGGAAIERSDIGGRTAKTDDRGQYRLYDLPPGNYYVSVAERAMVSTSGGRQVDSSQAIYYPGRPSIAESQPLQVVAAAELSGVNVTLAPFDGAHLAGMALLSTGKPVDGTALLSVSSRAGVPIPEPRGSSIDSSGQFEFRHVPPGEYVVQVIGRRLWGVSEEFAAQTVFVQGNETFPLAITTSAPPTLTGTIRIEGSLPSVGASQFTLMALPADPDFTAPAAIERSLQPRSLTRDNWTFEIAGLTGTARIAAAVPDGWWLKSVTIDGINVADEPFAFRTSEDTRGDVDVVIASGAAAISGRVLGARDRPAHDCSVIVFPTEASRIYPGSRYLGLVRSGPDGRFSVTNLPPGEYWVAAVYEAFEDRQTPEELSGLTAGARMITLEVGERATLELRSPR